MRKKREKGGDFGNEMNFIWKDNSFYSWFVVKEANSNFMKLCNIGLYWKCKINIGSLLAFWNSLTVFTFYTGKGQT